MPQRASRGSPWTPARTGHAAERLHAGRDGDERVAAGAREAQERGRAEAQQQLGGEQRAERHVGLHDDEELAAGAEPARGAADEEAEKEREAVALIDWHDFAVVETIDFEDGEDDDEGPEVATKFAKPVRRGRRRDDDDA